MGKLFLSGNEALAYGVRLARPHVISAYPITPQTVVVEKLSEMVEDGSLKSEFIHVESEHSALSCAIGASAIGARTFTATSSQGLLYMAECLPYASGGRFPIVMMNGNRATALPWNIYGDQRDSISQLDSGWIQVYVENAQESLDMALQSYFIAEHEKVSTPVMINLDGFQLTHTYESVEIPSQEDADKYLPPYETKNKMDLDNPTNMAYSVGPDNNMEFKLIQHLALNNSKEVIIEADKRFENIFGRKYGGLIEEYRCEDAEYILISLGSISGICREAADKYREKGIKAGFLKIRYLRPFPKEEIINVVKNAKAIGVLEKDISFGYEGTVYTNVLSAIGRNKLSVDSYNFIAGLGGRDIKDTDVEQMYEDIINGTEKIKFVGLEVEIDV